MKILKLAQNTPNQPNATGVSPQAQQEIMSAVGTLNKAIANVNQSLKIIEQNNINQLFQRDTLIKAIQAGEIAALDINKINNSLTAMNNIARSIPVINSSLKVLQVNDSVARQMKMDIANIQNVIVTSIQSGNYSQFTQVLQGFQAMLPAMSGTQGGTTI